MERKILQDRKGFSNSFKFIVAQKKKGGRREEKRNFDIEEKRKEKGKTETQRGNGNKERKGEKKNEVEVEAEGSVGENNFRDIGLVASSSSFSRIFTFHSPLKSAIEFHHRIPPPPPGERKRKSLLSRYWFPRAQRTVKRRSSFLYRGGNDNSKTQLFG